MKRFTHTLIKVGAIATLTVGTYTLPVLALAAPPTNTVAITAADLQAKADHHAMMAADYRARMRVDEKHAIQWFTLANRLDQEAQRYRMAALAAGAEPVYRR
jgi:hypothetical protein